MSDNLLTGWNGRFRDSENIHTKAHILLNKLIVDDYRTAQIPIRVLTSGVVQPTTSGYTSD